MKSLQKRRSTALILAVVWLAVCLVLTLAMGQTKATEDYEIKLLAAQKLQDWMDDIRDYKLEAGLSLTPYDTHKTGMIGDDYTPITTSLGSEEAKRTTANPDMAALLVQMLTEAGVKSGDSIGAGFSGSFPTLNLAVLAAGEAMNVKVIYIASMGASTFGANQPQFTFPDMVCRLYLDGRLQTPPALITPGGDYDCGGEMFEEEKEEALARIASYGVADIMQERDFAANLKAREDLYETLGPISCFVGVGGNITTIGLEEDKMKAGVMVPYTVTSVRSDDGLLQYYNAHGLPVLHLLNIKQLAAQYGLPFDPETIVPPGQSALYYHTVYPHLPALVGVLGAVCILVFAFKRRSMSDDRYYQTGGVRDPKNRPQRNDDRSGVDRAEFFNAGFIYGTELSGAGVYASCVGKAGEYRSDGGCFTPGDVKCPARCSALYRSILYCRVSGTLPEREKKLDTQCMHDFTDPAACI